MDNAYIMCMHDARRTLRPLFGPLKNLRTLLEQRMSELVAKDAAQVGVAVSSPICVSCVYSILGAMISSSV